MWSVHAEREVTADLVLTAMVTADLAATVTVGRDVTVTADLAALAAKRIDKIHLK